MRRLLTLWRCQLQEYIWWHVATAFLVLVFVSCGLSQAFGLEELEAVFGEFCFWVALRGLLRELCASPSGAVHGALSRHAGGAVRAVRSRLRHRLRLGLVAVLSGLCRLLTFLFLLLPQGIVVLVSLSAPAAWGWPTPASTGRWIGVAM